MFIKSIKQRPFSLGMKLGFGSFLLVLVAMAVIGCSRGSATPTPEIAQGPRLAYQERKKMETSGFFAVLESIEPWPPRAVPEGNQQVVRESGLPQHRLDRQGPGRIKNI